MATVPPNNSSPKRPIPPPPGPGYVWNPTTETWDYHGMAVTDEVRKAFKLMGLEGRKTGRGEPLLDYYAGIWTGGVGGVDAQYAIEANLLKIANSLADEGKLAPDTLRQVSDLLNASASKTGAYRSLVNQYMNTLNDEGFATAETKRLFPNGPPQPTGDYSTEHVEGLASRGRGILIPPLPGPQSAMESGNPMLVPMESGAPPNAMGLTPAEQAEIDKRLPLPAQLQQTSVDDYLARFPPPERFTKPEALQEFARTTQSSDLFKRDPNFREAVLRRINEGGENLAKLAKTIRVDGPPGDVLKKDTHIGGPPTDELQKAKDLSAGLIDISVSPTHQFDRFLATDPFGKLNDEMGIIARSREGATFAPYLLSRVNQGGLSPIKGGSFQDYLSGLSEDQFYGGAGATLSALLSQVRDKFSSGSSDFLDAGKEQLRNYALPLIQAYFQENVPPILWHSMADVVKRRADAYRFRNPNADLFSAFLNNNFSLPGA